MARSKKKNKKHRVRRRRVSGVNLKGVVSTTATVGAGAIASAFANMALKKVIPATMQTKFPWASGAVVAVAAAFIPNFIKNPMAMDFAKGMAAGGVIFAVNESFLSLPGIAGMGATTAGYRYTPKLNRTVGAPGFMDRPISGMSSRDLHAVGALYDN